MSFCNKNVSIDHLAMDRVLVLTSLCFRLGMAFMIVLDLIAIAMNVLLIVALVRMEGRHVNVRTLLANLAIYCVVTSASHVIKGVRGLLLDGLKFPPTSSVSEIYRCKLEQFPESTANAGLAVGMTIIAFERMIATRHHETYEKWSMKLGLGLAAVSWIQGLALNGLAFPWFTWCHLPFCNGMLAQKDYLLAFYSVTTIIVMAIVVPVYYRLVKLNRQKLDDFCFNQSQLSLTSRLQFRHGIEMAEVLIPTVLSHNVLSTVICCCVVVMLYYGPRGDSYYSGTVSYSIVDRSKLMPWIDVLVAVQSLIYPLVIFVKHKPVRKKLYQTVEQLLPQWLFDIRMRWKTKHINRIVDRSVLVTEIAVIAAEDMNHFQQLVASWDRAMLQRNPGLAPIKKHVTN